VAGPVRTPCACVLSSCLGTAQRFDSVYLLSFWVYASAQVFTQRHFGHLNMDTEAEAKLQWLPNISSRVAGCCQEYQEYQE
jgi:hypothetical protein